MFLCRSLAQSAAMLALAFLLVTVPQQAAAFGRCDSFPNWFLGVFFQSPDVQILGRWQVVNGTESYHFAPNGYVNKYIQDQDGRQSGYWKAERCYPQLGKMDLNITFHHEGEMTTFLYLSEFGKGNNAVRFTPMDRNPEFGYSPRYEEAFNLRRTQ